MGKVTNYLAFVGVLILMFTMAGIEIRSPTGYLLGFLSDPTLWSTSGLLAQITGVIGGIIIGGISITALIAFRDPVLLRAPVAIFLLAVAWDIIGIFNAISSKVDFWLAILLTAPLMLVYAVSVFEWWSGSDT